MPHFCRNKKHTVLFPTPTSPISLVPRVSPNCYKETRKDTQNHNWIFFILVILGSFWIMLSTFVLCDDVKNGEPRSAEDFNHGPDASPTLEKINLAVFLLEWDTPSNTIVTAISLYVP
jgi:hypothetical protein